MEVEEDSFSDGQVKMPFSLVDARTDVFITDVFEFQKKGVGEGFVVQIRTDFGGQYVKGYKQIFEPAPICYSGGASSNISVYKLSSKYTDYDIYGLVIDTCGSVGCSFLLKLGQFGEDDCS